MTIHERTYMTCARCGQDTGNNHQGPFHFCCPDDCELTASVPLDESPLDGDA